MPIFDFRSTFGFACVWINELFFCEWFMILTIAFLTFYAGICTYFQPCIDDLTSLVEQANAAILDKISVKEKLVEYFDLHLHFYT